NPMSTVLKCELCGRSMIRRVDNRNNEERIMCKFCKENVSSIMNLVEEKLIESLIKLLKDYKIKYKEKENRDIELDIQQFLNKINIKYKKKNYTYNYIEKGNYDKDT